MNTTVSVVGSSTEHPPSPHPEKQTRRVGFADRLALHLGIALIKWGRRPYGPSRERRANRIEQQLAAIEREHSAEGLYRLTMPLR